MAFCTHCGKEIDEKAVICPGCGCAVNGAVTVGGAAGLQQGERVAAAVGYLGLLVLVPLLAFKNSAFCRFHANQSLVLLILNVAINAASRIFSAVFKSTFLGASFIGWIFTLLSIAVTVLAIVGIVYAAQGKQTELPLVGQIKILK